VVLSRRLEQFADEILRKANLFATTNQYDPIFAEVVFEQAHILQVESA
jgi:hypothetical protein